ncbi:YdcF family protein, partial [Frankia tisae]
MTAGLHDSEAETMATRLMELGIPEHVLIIEPFAMNTGENVWRSRELAERMLPLEERRSVIAIGKICSARRYLMTLARHWPGPIVTAQWVNYFAVDKSDWHLDPEFAERVRA